MVPSGLKYSQNVPIYPKLFKMIPSGPKWYQMVLSSLQWSQMVSKGSKCSKWFQMTQKPILCCASLLIRSPPQVELIYKSPDHTLYHILYNLMNCLFAHGPVYYHILQKTIVKYFSRSLRNLKSWCILFRFQFYTKVARIFGAQRSLVRPLEASTKTITMNSDDPCMVIWM